MGQETAYAGNSYVDKDKTITRVNYLRTVKTGTLASLNQEVTIIYAPEGYIGRVKYFGFYVPAIAGSTGTHEFWGSLTSDTTYSADRPSVISANGTSSLSLSGANQQSPVPWIIFDSVKPLVLTYYNGTNMAQTVDRMSLVIYELEEIRL